jgi:hypothetical protein
MTMEGGEFYAFDWAALVPHVVHPLKVAIIEALVWIGEPLSPAELERILDHQFGLSLVSYHVNKLVETGVLEPVGNRPVRGAMETFYFFAEAA